MQTSCQQLIESGPFRHNSRARVTVERDAADLLRILIVDPKIRTTIVIADSHLRELRTMIDTVLAADDEAAILAAWQSVPVTPSNAEDVA